MEGNNMDKSRKAYHEQVAESLIAQLKQGTAPWQKPWQPGDPLLSFPHNPTTQKRYRGINALYLMSQDYADPRWLTYKQAAGLGAQVRKGEKSTWIQYWKFTDERIRKDDNGKCRYSTSNGKPVKETVKQTSRVFYASVFNAEQIDNLPELVIRSTSLEPDWACGTDTAGVQCRHWTRWVWRPLPASTTGYTCRTNTSLKHRIAITPQPCMNSATGRDMNRAWIVIWRILRQRRLCAWRTACRDCQHAAWARTGIGHDPGQHAAYVASWIKTLEEDPTEIFRAAADAEKSRTMYWHLPDSRNWLNRRLLKWMKSDKTSQRIPLTSPPIWQQWHSTTTGNCKTHRTPASTTTKRLYLVADALKFCRNLSIDNLEFEERHRTNWALPSPSIGTGVYRFKATALKRNENDNGTGTNHVDTCKKN